MRAFIPFTSDNEIVAIGHGLSDLTLPKAAWTHAAHFAAAIWLIRCRPDLIPSRDMPMIIRAYNEATGVANTNTAGYHETITQASLRAARAFIEDSVPAKPLYELCNALMVSPLGNPDWLLTYWSKPVLLSVEARQIWVNPDIQELPF